MRSGDVQQPIGLTAGDVFSAARKQRRAMVAEGGA